MAGHSCLPFRMTGAVQATLPNGLPQAREMGGFGRDRNATEADDRRHVSFSFQQGIKVTYRVRSRGPSSSTSITDCHVPSTSFPADTGTVSDGPRIDEAI